MNMGGLLSYAAGALKLEVVDLLIAQDLTRITYEDPSILSIQLEETLYHIALNVEDAKWTRNARQEM